MDERGSAGVIEAGLPMRSSSAYDDAVDIALSHRHAMLDTALTELRGNTASIAGAASLVVATLRNTGKVLAAGNGGSAAEAQHFAAELVGRFKRDRAPYAALALTVDSSIITAVGNDYGFEQVFSRQILGLGRRYDLLLVFSTSGESENVVRAAVAAHGIGMTVVAVTGGRSSRLEDLADVTVRVPVTDTAAVQELHMLVTHILCDIVESELSGDGAL